MDINIKVRRGDIWEADLNDNKGDIINKVRPVIIMSNWRANDSSDNISIIPITSTIKFKSQPTHVNMFRESNLPKQSIALAESVMPLSKAKSKRRIGYAPEWKILELGNATDIHFGFNPKFSQEAISKVKEFTQILDELGNYLKYKYDKEVSERYSLYSKYLKKYCQSYDLPVNWQKYEVKENGYRKKYA